MGSTGGCRAGGRVLSGGVMGAQGSHPTLPVTVLCRGASCAGAVSTDNVLLSGDSGGNAGRGTEIWKRVTRRLKAAVFVCRAGGKAICCTLRTTFSRTAGQGIMCGDCETRLNVRKCENLSAYTFLCSTGNCGKICGSQQGRAGATAGCAVTLISSGKGLIWVEPDSSYTS